MNTRCCIQALLGKTENLICRKLFNH